MSPDSKRWILLLLLVASFFAWRESTREPLAAFDRAFAEWLSVQRADQVGEAPPVVLVEIGNSSMKLKPEWPWTPLDYALFLKAVQSLKPAVVAIEPVLSWPGQTPEYMDVLADYALKTPKLLLAVDLAGKPDPEAPKPRMPFLPRVNGDRSQLIEMPGVLQVPATDLTDAGQLAPVNLAWPGACPGARPAALVRFAGQLVPTFPLQIAAMHGKVSPTDIDAVPGSKLEMGSHMALPLDAEGRILIDAREAARIVKIEYDDLLLAIEKRDAGLPVTIPLERFKDAIVIMGRTDEASRTCSSPISGKTSGVETIAAAVATLTGGSAIRFLPPWSAAVVIAVCLALWPMLARMPKFSAVLVLFAVAAAYGMISVGVASFAGVALPAALPAAMFVAMALVRILMPPVKAPE